MEPRLALAYSSEARNGFVGVGWTLAGFSTIERANPGRGTPRFDATDIYLLDGQELVACVEGSVSPSCTSGGTHSTKIESYLKIRFDSPINKWTVWGKDGTRTVFSSTVEVTAGTFRWGQTSVVDTKGNTVTYSWFPIGGDYYPDQIDYNGYRIRFYRENRTDTLSAAAYSQLTQTLYRIRSIVVSLANGQPIRAYKLLYTYSSLTGRSLLASSQQYGKDVSVGPDGAISGPTFLPPVMFASQTDPFGKSFQSEAPNPPTPPNTLEPVVWANHNNTEAVPPGNTLRRGLGNQWNAGASSTRAIVSGNGYVEATATGGTHESMVGLSNGDTTGSYMEIDFAIYEASGYLHIYENGVLVKENAGTVVAGNTLRVEVQSGFVYYKKNSSVLHAHAATPTYPLLVDTSISTPNGAINNVVLYGSLQEVNFWCQGALLLTGDFNADGRTDQLCYRHELLTTQVALGTATGFSPPVLWLYGQALFPPVVGDFNADGKADIANGPDWDGFYSVNLSTGSAFGPSAPWGQAWVPGSGPSCSGDTVEGTGDFNGDGITDVSCRKLGNGKIFIGLSNGTNGFSFSIFADLGCEVYEQTGAIDFDGDGKDDWYCIGMNNNDLLVFPSTGNSFLYPAFGSLNGTFCDGPSYILGDLNGDGRVDATCRSNGKVALSTGHQFIIQSGTFGGWCGGSTNFFAADVDGDGASEIVCNNWGDIQVRKWQGGTLGPVETWRTSWCSTSVSAGDFNGDGKTDLLCNSQATPVAVAGAAGFQADLLSSIVTSLGGTIRAYYGPATSFPNTNVAKQVTTNVTVNDGRTPLASTSYYYSDGRMDPKERRFLGFRSVREAPPCVPGSPACPYVQTLLRQDLPSAGKIERRDHYSEGTNLRIEVYTYTTNSAPPFTSLLTEESHYFYDGTGASKTTYAQHQYDPYGNRTQTVLHGDTSASGDEKTLTWAYQPNTSLYIVDRVGRQQQFVGPNTNGTKLAERQFLYDGAGAWQQAPSQGYVTASRGWLDTTQDYVQRNMVYDNFGNLTSVRDEEYRPPTTTEYDTTYRMFPTLVTNGAGETETTTGWDPICGLPSDHTDANNQVTHFQPADALCRPTRLDLPLGGFEIRTYLNVGNPNTQHIRVERPSTTPGDNLYTEEYFDGLGRTYRTVTKGPTPAQNILQDTTYNVRGLVASHTAPYYAGSTPQVTTYLYDALGRVVSTQFPDGNDITKDYFIWSEKTYDEHNHPVFERYNAYGHKVLTEIKHGEAFFDTQYSFDLLGRMTGMTDAFGNAWEWKFDSLGRNWEKTDPDSGTWSFTHDDSGLLSRQTDAKQEHTDFTYDLAGRLWTKVNDDETVTFTRSEPRSGYYNVARVSTVQAVGTGLPTRTLTVDHDARGRPVKQARNLEGVTYTAQKQYGTGDFLQSITYPDDDTIGPMGYDAAGRMNSIPGIVTNILYDASGRATQQANANGTSTTRTYSAQRGFLTAIQTTGPGGTLQNLAYTPDPTGLTQQVTSTFPNEGWDYTYDDLHRLTTSTSLSTPAESQTFQYDEINRMTYNSRLGSYSYPAPGAPRPHAPLTVAGNSYEYDLNGNMFSGGGRTITWSVDNMPRQVNATQFIYDGLGERLKKMTGGSTSVYPMGDDYEVTNGLITKYISVEGLGVVAKRVKPVTGYSTVWLHTDRLGSIQVVTGTSGVEIQRRTYRLYGEKIADTTSYVERRGWIDQRTDSETGVTYLHARYYDPVLGTFLSPDPIGPEGGFNEYGYGPGDPINTSDRSGLMWAIVCGTIGDRWECFRADYEEVWSGGDYRPPPADPNNPNRDPYGGREGPTDPSRGGAGVVIPPAVIPPLIIPPGCAPTCEVPPVSPGDVADVVDELLGVNDLVTLLGQDASRQEKLQALVNLSLMVLGGTAEKFAKKAIGGVITGYATRSDGVKHGLLQAISRDGVGVSPAAMLDAVRNPMRIVTQERGTTLYIGRDAVVSVNPTGEVVTTWATNRNGWRE